MNFFFISKEVKDAFEVDFSRAKTDFDQKVKQLKTERITLLKKINNVEKTKSECIVS